MTISHWTTTIWIWGNYMRQIDVEIYEKRTHCPNCLRMRSEFDRWLEQTENEVEVTTDFIEDNPEIIEQSGAKAAPIYKITDIDTDEVSFVSGPQTDLLVDTLEGRLDIWN